ncbi:MAG: YcaO-like family protein [Desulfobacterales bacterium]|uniref:YcaO-like family protein n=1 Tax=Candidatus Desulfaltia bathyphila TaxID=2841697 RepID=A0A8J6N996_9BACT|nr:YcaO-like family protein [Candidatus Desulfaltia bathyphila]MBL7195250.1 YcaO-like family protein [Desulfobacterales bacterium]MBL7208091.1 YcaO-like family protein [Desulfobacterales bacterium]
MPNKIILNDAFKGFTLDQDKIVPPEETVKRFKKKLKSLDLDILKHTKRIDNGRLGIPVYLSSCGKDALSVIGTKKQMGKGATTHQAEASAVMELAERFSFYSFRNNADNFIVEKYRNLKDKAIPFETIVRSVHDDSKELETTTKIFENIPLKWTKAYNLTQDKEILIPFDWFFTINEFNGTSVGNCTEEALIQGICEVVERHTSSIISQNSLKTPSINADSVREPLVEEMIQKYRNAGIKLYISDFTLDLGIPTVGILAYDPSTFPEKSEIVWTAGTTPDPQKALSRALSEVAQLAGDFNTCSNYVASGLPKLKKIKKAAFITNSETKINITDLPDISDNNIKIEVQNCVSILAKKKFEVIIVNTTHPLLEIPAFYTIIPGAHFRERSLETSVGMFSAKLISKNTKPEEAVCSLKKMDDLLPGKYYVKFYLGLCHLSMNDQETALTYFNQALELNPIKQDAASIYSYMGVCLKSMGEYRKALEVLNKGEKSDSARTDIYNLMGFCNFSLKEYEKAIECFQKVLKLDPGSAIDYANIASNYRDMGKRGKAIKYYEIALSIDPEIDFARTNLEKLRRI